MQDSRRNAIIILEFILLGAIFVLACILYVNPISSTPNGHQNELVASRETTQEAKALSTSPKIVCYLTIPGDPNSEDYLSPLIMDPNLCTHILVGFATVSNCSIHLGDNIQIYKDAVYLKNKNPNLKVMVSVGGGDDISSGFPTMTRNHANRKIFIRSVLDVTKTLNLDGLDIDWEFPAWPELKDRQRIHFVQLLYELKKAFIRSNRKLILSAAVAATQVIIDQCYNVPQIAEHVDFVNLMAYDYHFYSRLLPMTGLNAPLYSSPTEKQLWSKMNVNYSCNYWVEQGMPREKIVVGIPTYGHSFKLNNAENNGLYAPCNGYGSLGSAGCVSYPTVCSFLRNGATSVFLNHSKVPYAFQNTEWISYDDVVSVTEKANWIKSNAYGGAMIFSLNADDWNSSCNGDSSFPLTRAVKKTVWNENEAI